MAKAKRASSAAQKRAQADLAAFRAFHGRAPNKGESTKGYASGAAAAPKKRRRKARPKPALVRAWRWVRKNPIKAAASAAGLAGTAAIATSPRRRAAVARGAANVRSFLPQ